MSHSKTKSLADVDILPEKSEISMSTDSQWNTKMDSL